MKRQNLKGFTLIELLVVVAIIALLIAILIPSLGRAKELANRSSCGANVSGIVKAMNIYSNDNNDTFPFVFNGQAVSANNVPSQNTAGSASADATINNYYVGNALNEPGRPTLGMWILAIKGLVGTKSFICKSDPAGPKQQDLQSSTGSYFIDFGQNGGISDSVYGLSYSMNYPMSSTASSTVIGGWTKASVDSSLPVVADIAPKNNTGTQNTTNISNLFVTGGGVQGGNVKTVNSKNHSGGEGQNVGFSDTHVEFNKTPYVGQIIAGSPDGIYSFQNAGTPVQIASTGSSTSAGTTPYDTFMAPVRDNSNNTLN